MAGLMGTQQKGRAATKFKKHGVEAAKSVGINKAEIKMAARWAAQAMACKGLSPADQCFALQA